MTELVRQEDKSGCAIACMAMVLGKTYQEVKSDLVGDFRDHGDGLTIDEVADYLSDHGFQSIHKATVFRGSGTNWGREYLLEPFAPIHIVRIRFRFNTTNHVVVMTDKGEFLDPDGKSDAEIRESYLIMSCLGLFPE